MRITSKGQVTIPAALRESAGLMPNTDVDFDFDGKFVRLRPAKQRRPSSRGARIVAHLRGTANLKFTTEEIMAMTRGED